MKKQRREINWYNVLQDGRRYFDPKQHHWKPEANEDDKLSVTEKSRKLKFKLRFQPTNIELKFMINPVFFFSQLVFTKTAYLKFNLKN